MTLPPTTRRCTAIELLRLADNQLAALPDWLLLLPRLGWLALANNPARLAVGGEVIVRHPCIFH
jgi:hypothetical protein